MAADEGDELPAGDPLAGRYFGGAGTAPASAPGAAPAPALGETAQAPRLAGPSAEAESHARAPFTRKGWEKVGDKWVPTNAGDRVGAPDAVDPGALDLSLDASHERMTRTLALAARRIELAAERGALTEAEIDTLARLSGTWRTLVTNQPPPDYAGLTDEQLRAQLDSVKRRGK